MAGSSLRRARSPVAPKMTISAGAMTRYSWRPSRSGFASAVAGAVSLAMARRAHRVATELLAHHRHHPVAEGVGVAAPEALEERVRDGEGGHVLVDRGLHRPAALAGVLD